MSTNASSGQESGGRTDPQPAHRNGLAAAADEKTLKRARWEHLRLAPVAGAQRVNVCNVSYGVQAKNDHTYTVTVERGEPTDCTCSAATYQSGPCKHAVAVAGDREVIDEAMGATEGSERNEIATDGGRVGDETCADCGLPLDEAHKQPAGYTRVLLDGGEICGACADIRYGYSRVDGRLTLDELEERAAEPVIEPEVRG
ncbi:SWIM zinc finger family protein [Halococcus agarilyticus]|uniref:SWIM zinc finger family protein n=1 Tax=Halococcus agarilyticus TaxID=1232219 RepID=UPI0006776D7B|nr:SWIM zinc finger family protein [Halococcus agarilyticus]